MSTNVDLEVNLLLDASNHDKASDIVQLMNRMSHGGFSNTLSLVCIPTVAHDDSSQGKPEKSTPKAYPMNHRTPRQRTPNPNLGLSALIKVFDRLHSLGVRDILRLEVEDRRHPSHTDSAIEMALQGRDSLSTESRTRGAISIETW